MRRRFHRAGPRPVGRRGPPGRERSADRRLPPRRPGRSAWVVRGQGMVAAHRAGARRRLFRRGLPRPPRRQRAPRLLDGLLRRPVVPARCGRAGNGASAVLQFRGLDDPAGDPRRMVLRHALFGRAGAPRGRRPGAPRRLCRCRAPRRSRGAAAPTGRRARRSLRSDPVRRQPRTSHTGRSRRGPLAVLHQPSRAPGRRARRGTDRGRTRRLRGARPLLAHRRRRRRGVPPEPRLVE